MGAVAAVGLKLYAAIPLLTRWRHLVIAGAVIAAVTLILPWQMYLDRGWASAATCRPPGTAAHGGVPFLVAPTLVGLRILRRQGAEWFAVPAVFPATQFYYAAMALPALVGRPPSRASPSRWSSGPARRDRAGGPGRWPPRRVGCRDHGTGAPSTSLRHASARTSGGMGRTEPGTSRSVRGSPYCATIRPRDSGEGTRISERVGSTPGGSGSSATVTRARVMSARARNSSRPASSSRPFRISAVVAHTANPTVVNRRLRPTDVRLMPLTSTPAATIASTAGE